MEVVILDAEDCAVLTLSPRPDKDFLMLLRFKDDLNAREEFAILSYHVILDLRI